MIALYLFYDIIKDKTTLLSFFRKDGKKTWDIKQKAIPCLHSQVNTKKSYKKSQKLNIIKFKL